MSEVTQDMIDCWRVNYGLATRTPDEAMRLWEQSPPAGMAPAGAVAALGLLLQEREAMARDAERYRWLRDRLLAADFDYNGEGVCG